jgi:hypothetical protein
MLAESLEVLEQANLPPAQARAIVKAIELEISGAKDTLATKHDILSLRGEISKLDTALRGEISKLDTALRGEMAAQRGELEAEIHATGRSIVRQLYLAVLGQMAVMLGFGYVFATNLR